MLALLAAGCLEPIDHEGKLCPTGTCPAGYACSRGVCTAGRDAGTADGGLPDAGGPVSLVVAIAADEDDGLWCNEDVEALAYSQQFPFVQVGDDEEACATGLRFRLPVPRRARILSAQLRLWVTEGNARETDLMGVRTYLVPEVAPFDPRHRHVPAEHADGGLSGRVGGWPVGDETDPGTFSPELAPIVQQVVDGPGWAPGQALGFVVDAVNLGGRWAMFADFSSPDARDRRAELHLRYQP